MKDKLFYFKIAEQVGNIGVYGEIELKCEPDYDSDTIEIILNEESKQFEAGVRFGIIYYVENCVELRGIKVNVNLIEFNPVDTNNLVIAYIIFFAIYEGLNLKVKNIPIFDKKNASFVFMK